MSSPKAFLILVTFLQANFSCVLCQQNEEAVILNGPHNQTVAPGSTVYFICHAQGIRVYWCINGSYADHLNVARGFNVSYNQTSGNTDELEEYNNTIVVEARPSNNNTLISCIATANIYDQQAFQEGTLIIAGPPLAPSLDLNIDYFNNESHMIAFNLVWSTPFTWDGFPIISYTITIVLTNYSDGREAISVDTFDITSTQDNKYQHNITINNVKDCYVINFTVVAINSVGSGEYSHIQYSNGIELGEIGDIETAVTFLSNGTPHFWMSFLVPSICPNYQVGIYNISIYDYNHHNLVHYLGPTNYTQNNIKDREVITKEVKSELILGWHYIVEVIVESLGIVRFQNKTFDTNFKALTCKVSKGVKQGAIVGSILGTAFFSIVCLLLVTIIILVVLLTWKRKLSESETDGDFAKSKPRRKKDRATTHKIMNNPIYEGGAVYETTPGESFKPLIISSSTPSLHTTISTPIYHVTSPAPNLPSSIPTDMECAQPYLIPVGDIKGIKAASTKLAKQSQGGQCGDEYMEIGPSHPKKDMTIEMMTLHVGNVTVSEKTVNGDDSEDTYVTLH